MLGLHGMRRCKYGIANTTLQMGQRKWAVAIGGVAKPGQPNGVGRPGPFLPACQAQRRHKNGAAVTPPWRKPCRGAMQHGTRAQASGCATRRGQGHGRSQGQGACGATWQGQYQCQQAISSRPQTAWAGRSSATVAPSSHAHAPAHFSSAGLRGLTVTLPAPHARTAGQTRRITVGAAPATPPHPSASSFPSICI